MSDVVSQEPFLHLRTGGLGRTEVEGDLRHASGLRPAGAGGEGIFAEWAWDGERLTVRNDRYGFQPLFFFAAPGEVCLSTSVDCLLRRGAPRELDWDAISVFLRLGYYLGEDTPFRAIRAVPPSAEVQWDREGFRATGKLPAPPQVNSVKRSDAVRTYQELFAEAVRRRRPDGPFAVTLSGGRDSRHILFELCRQGRLPAGALTIDLPGNTDGSVAARVAAAVGVPHSLIAPPPLSVALELEKNRATHYCADEHAWMLALPQAFAGRFGGGLFDGIGGDVLSAGLFLDAETLGLFRARRFTELARRLLAQDNMEPFLRRFLKPEALARVSEERAIERLKSELARHADAPNPCGSFIFWNRTRREIALSPFSVLKAFPVHTPYLDAALVDFLSSLPAEMFLDHTFHDETIRTAYPEWAAIPFGEKRTPALPWSHLGLAWRVRAWLKARPRTSLNLSYLSPRLLRAGLDPFYNRGLLQDLLSWPIYWRQLEEIAGDLETTAQSF